MNTTKKNLFKFLLALSALSLVETSFAAPCDPPGDITAFDTTNVTFETRPSDRCAEISGNPGNGDLGTTDNELFGSNWVLFLKADETPTGNLMDLGGDFASWNVDFTLTDVTIPGQSGDWTLTWDDNGTETLPLELDLLVALKASNRAGAFLFGDLVFNDDPATGTGEWSIQFENNGGNTPNISNFTIYVANPSTPGGGPPTNVPVPAPLALIAAGLFAITRIQRRAKSK